MLSILQKVYRIVQVSPEHWCFFVVSVIYLHYMIKDKHIKYNNYAYAMAILVPALFNPLSVYILYKGIGEAYYNRVFWVFQVTVLCCYAATVLVKKKKAMIALVVLIIALEGNYTYNAVNSPGTNLYKIPQEIMDVCDEITELTSQVKAAFTPQDAVWVRQYTAAIDMPYGRYGSSGQSQIDTQLEADNTDYEILSQALIAEECGMLVLPAQKGTTGIEILAQYGYDMVIDNENYMVFWNKDVRVE